MELGMFYLPIPVALALVALLGYLIGCYQRRINSDILARSERELRRAKLVAAELEQIADKIRRHLSQHQASLCRFKEHVGRLNQQQRDATWKELCHEAEEILKPTLQLANQMASAYDEIRQQSANLMTFTEVRTDPLTGIQNRRGLEDALASQFALMNRYGNGFSAAIFDIDHFKQVNDRLGHLVGDRMLQELGRLLDEQVRETDIVGRYGGEEFLVIMPHTDLQGAAIFSDRLRVTVQGKLELTISGGVAAAIDGDTRDSLLARADSALYGAKSGGRNCVYRHTGQEVEPVVEPVIEPVVEPVVEPVA